MHVAFYLENVYSVTNFYLIANTIVFITQISLVCSVTRSFFLSPSQAPISGSTSIFMKSVTHFPIFGAQFHDKQEVTHFITGQEK
jgi:hypothetical protein